MKKLLLFILCAAGCNAMNLKITKIVKDLDLYVFEDKYVCKVSSPIKGKGVGSRIEINMDLFYETNGWLQDIEHTEKILVGTTYETEETLSEPIAQAYEVIAEPIVQGYEVVDEEPVRTRTTATNQYAYESFITTYRITPVGVAGKALTFVEFIRFADQFEISQPLKNCTTVYTDNGYLWADKDIERQNFSYHTTGEVSNIHYLSDLFMDYPEGYTNEIFPIFDVNNTSLLAGVLNCSYKWKKPLIYDYINTLAIFE